MNQPKDVLNDMLEGFCYTHEDLVSRINDTGVICRKFVDQGKVALVSGGGSGHEPSHAGYVGQGMLSAAVCGEVFTSPTPDQILEAIKQADQGAGVLLIVKNYTGDIMNFEMAQELAEMEGISVEHIVVNDDISLEPRQKSDRRGVAGTVFVHKILGAAAENGATLSQLKNMGNDIVTHMATLGVSLLPATVPEVGKPGFDLAEDELEFGIGIHGEPGYRREQLKPSKGIAQELVSQLKSELQWEKGEHIAVLVNGLGATPLMEQFIFMNDVQSMLQEEALVVDYKKVGNYMTAIDMAGVSLTILRLADADWKTYLQHPVQTPAPF